MNPKLPSFQRFSEKSINFRKTKQSNPLLRIYLLPVFVILIFLILLARLFQLTIVKGSYYRFLAENNRLREIEIEAPRGKILDRKNFTLAYSTTENEKTKRIYNDAVVFAHLIGYRQLASEEDLKNDLCSTRIKLNDKIGKEGVEKIYDCQLRGKKGKKLIEVDAEGKYLKTVTLVPPTEGKSIRLSVDGELQKKAYQLIAEKKAVIVASKPQTGEILILSSSPSYDTQAFEDNNQSVIKNFLEDKNQPLFNRATRGTYPPGSTIKPLLAAAALEEKAIDEHFSIEDTGTIKVGPLTFGNWYFLQYGKTEGMIDVVKAIRRSNDIFFYKTGERLGWEKIKNWLEKFGLGKPTGVKLGEEEGLIPSSFWKEEVFHDRWYLGDTYNLSIGQGYILVTPLQLNLATAVFANGGYLCKPKLHKIDQENLPGLTQLRKIETWQVEINKTPECRPIGLSQKTLDLIRKGMKEACSPGGTGWPLFKFKVTQSVKSNSQGGPSSRKSGTQDDTQIMRVACKTGTAESHGKNKPPHAWFTVYAPADKPEIVLTVLVEEGGQGADVAAPIAREILKAYFERRE